MRSYFDNQMLDILRHYCGIWAQMIIQYVLKSRRMNDREEMWHDRIGGDTMGKEQRYQNVASQLCVW